MIAAALCSFLFLGSSEASADPGGNSGSALTNSKEGAALKAWRSKQRPGDGGSNDGSSTKRLSKAPSYDQQLKNIQQQTDHYLAYARRKQSYDACISAGGADCVAPGDPV